MDFYVKHKIIKLLEENIRESLQDLGLGKEFLDFPPTQSIKRQKIYQDLLKLKLLFYESPC